MVGFSHARCAAADVRNNAATVGEGVGDIDFGGCAGVAAPCRVGRDLNDERVSLDPGAAWEVPVNGTRRWHGERTWRGEGEDRQKKRCEEKDVVHGWRMLRITPPK